MTKIIGLTGGIGSGKTSIARYFQSLGIPVYIADEEAKKLTNSQAIKQHLRNTFGDAIFENDIIVNEKLAAIVFKDPKQLERLNDIIHPAVRNHFQEWLTQHEESPLVVKEAAILFESGSYLDCNKIITVTAPLETRINRVIKRDNTTKEAVMRRIQNQWTDDMRISKSDYVIENTDLSQAKQQVDKILKKLLNPQN